jgi:hypothetical protein
MVYNAQSYDLEFEERKLLIIGGVSYRLFKNYIMKLKEFIEGLQKFAKENPDTLEMDVVTSKDGEGNGYNIVHYEPSKGIFEDREFISFEQYGYWGREEEDTNAVCVN